MGEPENTLLEAIISLVGTAWRVNNFTFVEQDLGFIYFAAPIAANIRTIGSLQKGVAQDRGEAFDIPNLQRVMAREKGLIATPKRTGAFEFNQMLEDASVIKFAFVRDPVERFSAIYRNQFSINTKNGMPRQKLFEFLGISLDENLTMLDLAELLVEEEGLKDLLPLFVPQRRMIAFDLVEYDFIGRHERWEKDYANIAMEIFGCETPVFDPTTELNIDPEGTKLFALVDDETRAAVEEAYAEDCEMIEEIDELFPDGFALES
jgi:hypothetical protein